MICIDKEKIFSEIKRKRPKAVILNAPQGILTEVQDIAAEIEKRYNIHAIIAGDPCYGICDSSDRDIKRLGADLGFHIGHSGAVGEIGRFTILVDALDRTSFDQVLELALPILRKHVSIGLCTISQHLHQLQRCKEYLEGEKLKTLVGKGTGQLQDGQIFGCQFYTVHKICKLVEAFVFLGQSRFHAQAVSLATGKPTYMLDPYMNEVVDVSSLAARELKKALLTIYKASEVERFGVVIGLKEGQIFLDRAIDIKRKMERLGKEVVLLALREVNPEKLDPFRRIGAFIQTACPRVGLDGYTFNKPVLSFREAEALIRVIEGKEAGDFLRSSCWV